MLNATGVTLIMIGILSFAIDRKARDFIAEHVSDPVQSLVNRTTHWAKGAHWLFLAVVVYGVAQVGLGLWGGDSDLRRLSDIALAFVASLTTGSVLLHVMKLVLGRSRPRDAYELGGSGIYPFRFDLAYNSFPSGHALTVFCVATMLSIAVPSLFILWFAGAALLALTRALIGAHWTSDIFIGAGMGIVVTRLVLIVAFPDLLPANF